MRSRSLALALCMWAAQSADAQTRVEAGRSPFIVGAASAGAIGFTAGGNGSALAGAYAYAAFPRLILGAQGGGTVGGHGAPDVLYGMATLGYPAGAIRASLVYPFIGVGGGELLGATNDSPRGMIYGAGVGADRVHGEGDFGLLVGFRAGYLFRAGDIGERAVYLSFAIGAGGRRTHPEEPPIIVARKE